MKKTLRPYSYQRLSRRAGYSAGNKVPAYYELLWDALRTGQPESHAARYLSTLAGHIRERGGMVSSAEVLEANLLAQSLASLREGRYPTHDELQDAAVTCMGHGSFGEIAEGLALTDIGTKIGEVPRSGLLTSIQQDFADQCADLKLSFAKIAVQRARRAPFYSCAAPSFCSGCAFSESALPFGRTADSRMRAGKKTGC